MLTYPWKCTVLHCNHLGNTWRVVSTCFPGGYNVKLYISRDMLAWWLLAFLHSVKGKKRRPWEWRWHSIKGLAIWCGEMNSKVSWLEFCDQKRKRIFKMLMVRRRAKDKSDRFISDIKRLQTLSYWTNNRNQIYWLRMKMKVKTSVMDVWTH